MMETAKTYENKKVLVKIKRYFSEYVGIVMYRVVCVRKSNNLAILSYDYENPREAVKNSRELLELFSF